MKKEICREYRLLCLVIVIQIAVLLFFGMNKEGMHVDEYFTYALANNSNGATIGIEDGVIYTSDFIKEFLTANEEEVFNYRQVVINQANNVHPPIYYFLVHAVCSIFEGKFSMWIGLGINIVLAVVITLVMYALYGCFIKDKKICVLLAFGTSLMAGMIESVLFLRMYEMSMLWLVLLTYLHVTAYQKRSGCLFYIALYVLSVVGALTHYFTIIYMFFMGAFWGIYLLVKRYWKDAVFYVFTMGLAGVTVYVSFPAVINHVLNSNRGTEVRANAFNAADLLDRLQEFGTFLNVEMFGGMLLVFLLFSLYSFICKKERYAGCQVGALALVAFSCIGYFMVVAKTASFIEERYIFPIFPLCYLVIMVAMVYTLGLMDNAKREICVLLVLLLLIGSHSNFDFPKLYEEEKENMALLETYQDEVCIVLYGRKEFRIFPSMLGLMKFERIIFVKEENLDKLPEYGIEELDDAVVYISKDYDAKNSLKSIRKMYDDTLDDWEQMFKMDYMTVYHIH